MPSHDAAQRRRTKRSGRQRGCWVYIPAEYLVAARIDPAGDPPWYRIWADKTGRPRFVLNLYREA